MIKAKVFNNPDKPHKGRIKNWTMQIQHSDFDLELDGKKIVIGLFVDHPDFKWGHTSWLVKEDAPNQFGYREVETKNSRYTLVGPELTWEEYVKVRQKLESDGHAQAYKLLSPEPVPKTVQRVPDNTRNKKKNVKPYYSRATQARPIARDRAK